MSAPSSGPTTGPGPGLWSRCTQAHCCHHLIRCRHWGHRQFCRLVSGPDERLGVLHFPISCGWESQHEFITATSLLHLFQFAEAEDAYTTLVKRDPECAMGYWGIALSRLRNPLYLLPTEADDEAARQALAAGEAARETSPRERAYLAAARNLFPAAASPGGPPGLRATRMRWGRLQRAIPGIGKRRFLRAGAQLECRSARSALARDKGSRTAAPDIQRARPSRHFALPGVLSRPRKRLSPSRSRGDDDQTRTAHRARGVRVIRPSRPRRVPGIHLRPSAGRRRADRHRRAVCPDWNRRSCGDGPRLLATAS